MILVEADQHVVGRWGRALREATAALQNVSPFPSVATWWPEASSRQVRSVAMRLCRMQRLLVCSADEVLGESSGATMLMRQASLGNTPAVRLLVDAGARPDAAHNDGQTALIHAALALVKECGANATTADNTGTNPVWAAASSGHTATVRAVVQECGANATKRRSRRTRLPLCSIGAVRDRDPRNL